MNDKVREIVTAAVIEALSKEGGSLVAEMTADVLNGKDNRYGGLLGLYMGRGDDGQRSYLEGLARDEIKHIVKEAVKEHFAARAADLKQQVIDRIKIEDVAGSYMQALHNAFDNDTFTVSIKVEQPTRYDDD
jgi:hypothetical protein